MPIIHPKITWSIEWAPTTILENNNEAKAIIKIIKLKNLKYFFIWELFSFVLKETYKSDSNINSQNKIYIEKLIECPEGFPYPEF